MEGSGCVQQSDEHCSTLQCPAPAVFSVHHPVPCAEKIPAAVPRCAEGLPPDEQQPHNELSDLVLWTSDDAQTFKE